MNIIRTSSGYAIEKESVQLPDNNNLEINPGDTILFHSHILQVIGKAKAGIKPGIYCKTLPDNGNFCFFLPLNKRSLPHISIIKSKSQ